MKRLSLLLGACLLLCSTGCVLVRRPQATLENKVLFVEPHQLHSAERYLDLEWGPDDHCVAIPIELTTSVQSTNQPTLLVSIVTPLPGGSHPPAAGRNVAYGFYDDKASGLPERCRQLAAGARPPAAGEARYVTDSPVGPGFSKRALLADAIRAGAGADGSSQVAMLQLPSSAGNVSVSLRRQLVIWFGEQFHYGDAIRLEIAQQTSNKMEQERSGKLVGYSRFDFRMLRGPGVLSGPAVGVGIIVLGTILLI